MPRAVVVTKLDQPRADFEESVAVCQRVFGEGVVPLYLPLHEAGSNADADDVVGVIGLLSQQVYDYSAGAARRRASAPSGRRPRARGADRGTAPDLIEAIIQESEDDALMDRYLGGEEVGLDILIPDLERAVARGSFYPVLPMVSPTGVGVHELLEILTEGFPSPLEHPLPAVTTPDGDPSGPLSCDPAGPLVAEVIKTTTDPYVGRVSLVRVFSGTLHPDTAVHVSGHSERFAGTTLENHEDHDVDEKVGLLTSPLGATLRPTGRCIAGDICAVGAADPGRDQRHAVGHRRPPAGRAVAAARTLAAGGDPGRLALGRGEVAESLGRLTVEDATVRVEHDPDTQQLVLWAMGEAHVDLVLDRLRDRYGVQVEAIRAGVPARDVPVGRHGTGPAGQAERRARPVRGLRDRGRAAAPGAGLEFVDKVVGGAVPRQYISSVEKGIRARAERGLMAGYPSPTSGSPSLAARRTRWTPATRRSPRPAGWRCEDAATSGMSLLEPVDEVEVTVDDEYVGAVMTDLSSRRGRVTGTEPLGNGRSTVRGDVPATSLARYAIELRSVAHGTGVFTRQYVRHDPVPANVADRILADTSDGSVHSSAHS